MRRAALCAAFAAGLVPAPAALSAQTSPIVVIGTRNLRPTAVLQPHLRYIVAADSNDERLLIKDLGIPPVLFAGSIRVEGIQPGARSFESRPFRDTLHFEGDGRVVLHLADHAERPPITVEALSSRSAIGGRILVTAPGLPLGRALLVTISPADISEMVFQGAGLGIRDRMRIDDAAGMAYLSDPESGPTTVAIGFGRGTSGRIQQDVGELVIVRDFGGETGRDRRQLGALLMAIDPSRDAQGVARAEVVFGVGNNEAEAADAARSAANETPAAPLSPSLRLNTPSAQVNLLIRHIMAAAGWQLNWDLLNNERTIVSSAARPTLRAHDAWLGSVLARQRGDGEAVCGSYRLLRAASAAGPTRLEVAPRLGNRGRYLAAIDSTSPLADAAMVLLAHACYQALRQDAFLRAEFPWVTAAATRAARDAPGALSADALERLAELDDELLRASNSPRTGAGDSLRTEAERMSPSVEKAAPTTLWRLITSEAAQGISRDYGRLSTEHEAGGLSVAAAGTFLDLVAGELFGITDALDAVEIEPAVDGIQDDFNWQLDGWLLGPGDTLSLSYRPADHRAAIKLSGPQRRRVVLKFPWLAAASCVTVRRGPDTEHPALVGQADGSFYVDLRGAYDPVELTVMPAACGG